MTLKFEIDENDFMPNKDKLTNLKTLLKFVGVKFSALWKQDSKEYNSIHDWMQTFCLTKA